MSDSEGCTPRNSELIDAETTCIYYRKHVMIRTVERDRIEFCPFCFDKTNQLY